MHSVYIAYINSFFGLHHSSCSGTCDYNLHSNQYTDTMCCLKRLRQS